jgi:hypothetical protein
MGRKSWWLTPRHGPVRWTVLFDPRVVLQVALSPELKSAEGLLTWCATSGVEFQTPSRPVMDVNIDHGLQAVHRDDRLAILKAKRLGFHPHGHQTTSADYIGYRRDCGVMLRDPVIAAAAVKASGFAWRIALSTIAPGIVLDGASNDARVLGICKNMRLSSGDEARDNYVDDVLQEEVERFLVGGFYTVREHNQAIQFAKTYFPPAKTFVTCGGSGSWTDRWEQLYQELDEAYVTGPRQPQTLATWQSRLRSCNGGPAVRRVWFAVEHHARGLLDARPADVHARPVPESAAV